MVKTPEPRAPSQPATAHCPAPGRNAATLATCSLRLSCADGNVSQLPVPGFAPEPRVVWVARPGTSPAVEFENVFETYSECLRDAEGQK
jgi:hypothetical protein